MRVRTLYVCVCVCAFQRRRAINATLSVSADYGFNQLLPPTTLNGLVDLPNDIQRHDVLVFISPE